MKINPNHVKDGQEAWAKSGLHYGQAVQMNGKAYKVVAIGYGMLFEGKAEIEDENGNKQTVKITDFTVTL